MTSKLLLAFSMAAACSGANAFAYKQCNHPDAPSETIVWKSPGVNAFINTVSFPTPALISSAIMGLTAVNSNPSVFKITIQQAGGKVKNGNGISEIYGAPYPDAPGVARTQSVCDYDWWDEDLKSHIKEVDIIVDTGTTFTTSQLRSDSDVYSDSGLPRLDSLIAHEAGHFVGLSHVNTIYQIMGDSWWHLFTDGKVAWTYFGEDASNGAVFLYGPRSDAFEDVSVSHFRYNGVNGEYSDHLRTRAFNVKGEELDGAEVEGDANGYLVKPAADIKLEFTIENSGRSPASNVAFEIRISGDPTFDKDDKVIAKGVIPSIVRDGPATLQFSAIMPRKTERIMRPGNAVYVGLLIDTANKIKEFDGRNNVAYIPFIIE